MPHPVEGAAAGSFTEPLSGRALKVCRRLEPQRATVGRWLHGFLGFHWLC